jgi:hypothetical protein
VLGDDLCAVLNEFPLIDHIAMPLNCDVDCLIGTAADGAGKLSALSISLLRRYAAGDLAAA